jgi:hypothetical protein
MGPLLFPPLETLPVGSDAWAFSQGIVSVVPLRAEFGAVGEAATVCVGDDGTARTPGMIWRNG